MATRNDSSTTALLILIVILTFPVWFAVGAALFGIVIGIFGAIIGVIAAIFGVIVAMIALPFKLLFGWGDWGWHRGDWFEWYHFPGKSFLFLFLLIIAAFIVRRRQKA